MRLWLRDSERRPDPEPLKSDDRTAIATGLVLWIIAAIVAGICSQSLMASGSGWVLTASIIGVILGLVGLVYTQLKRR